MSTKGQKKTYRCKRCADTGQILIHALSPRPCPDCAGGRARRPRSKPARTPGLFAAMEKASRKIFKATQQADRVYWAVPGGKTFLEWKPKPATSHTAYTVEFEIPGDDPGEFESAHCVIEADSVKRIVRKLPHGLTEERLVADGVTVILPTARIRRIRKVKTPL